MQHTIGERGREREAKRKREREREGERGVEMKGQGRRGEHTQQVPTSHKEGGGSSHNHHTLRHYSQLVTDRNELYRPVKDLIT